MLIYLARSVSQMAINSVHQMEIKRRVYSKYVLW